MVHEYTIILMFIVLILMALMIFAISYIDVVYFAKYP